MEALKLLILLLLALTSIQAQWIRFGRPSASEVASTGSRGHFSVRIAEIKDFAVQTNQDLSVKVLLRCSAAGGRSITNTPNTPFALAGRNRAGLSKASFSLYLTRIKLYQ